MRNSVFYHYFSFYCWSSMLEHETYILSCYSKQMIFLSNHKKLLRIIIHLLAKLTIRSYIKNCIKYLNYEDVCGIPYNVQFYLSKLVVNEIITIFFIWNPYMIYQIIVCTFLSFWSWTNILIYIAACVVGI